MLVSEKCNPQSIPSGPLLSPPSIEKSSPHLHLKAPRTSEYVRLAAPNGQHGVLPASSRTHSLVSSEPASFAPDVYGGGFVGSTYRPGKVSLNLSDSSSATSQSVPPSASSSSVHLPLSVNEMCDARSGEMQTHEPHILQPQASNSIPAPHAPFPDPFEPSHLPPQQPHRSEGGFSSAIGLISFEDRNALAGQVSFFSNLGIGVLPHSPNATPMPTRMQHPHLHQGRDRVMSLGALPTTPGLTKEADTRELNDMWKTYLRSPLGGSGTATLDLSTSQPSVTPTVEMGHPLMMNGGHGGLGAGGSTLRTTLHGNSEDLRSYEAAVNARDASFKLNLVPRRKGTRPTVNGSPPRRVPGTSPSSAAAGQTDQEISRPSNSSSTSSLAQAFTLQHPPQPLHHADPTRQSSYPDPSRQPYMPGDATLGRYPYSYPTTTKESLWGASLSQADSARFFDAVHHPRNHALPSHAHAPALSVVKSPPMQGASISLPSMSISGLHSNHAHLHGHSYLHSHPHSVALGSSTSLPFEPGSRASSDGTGTGGSGSDGEAFRPSFKRYPSQTLVPASSKRVLVERGGGESTGVKVDKGGLMEEDWDEVRKEAEGKADFDRVGVRAGVSSSPGSRPIAALPKRPFQVRPW